MEELKRESERQAALWRTCYGCVAVLVALFFAGTAAYQLVEPWGLVRLPGCASSLPLAYNPNRGTGMPSSRCGMPPVREVGFH